MIVKKDWKLNDTVMPEDMNRIEGNVEQLEQNKVDKVEGKGLSSNDFTNELKAKVERASNENLLDNWYFKKPVNQRGFTSVSMQDSNHLIDRWRIYLYTNGEAKTTAQGIELNGTFDFGEAIESDRIPNIPNLSITMSCKFSDGTIEYKTLTLLNNGGIEVVNFTTSSNVNIFFVRNWGKSWVIPQEYDIFAVSPQNTKCIVESVKLELGTQSTLVNDAPPNHAEELLRCQRYFESITLGNYRPCGSGFIANRTTAYAYLPCAIKKRINPTVSVNGGSFQIMSNGTYQDVTFSTAQTTPDGIVLELAGNFPNINFPCALVAINYPKLFVNSEL